MGAVIRISVNLSPLISFYSATQWKGCFCLVCFIFGAQVSLVSAAEPASSSECLSETDVSIADVVFARRNSNEFASAQLRLLGAESDTQLIDNFYTPIFSVNSQIGQRSDKETESTLGRSNSSAISNGDQRLDATVTQRLAGGGSVGLTTGREWGSSRGKADDSGQSYQRSSQYSYRLEARQPLLRGAGGVASSSLEVGKLNLEQARLNHRMFLQNDLVLAISVYADVVSSRQTVLQAKRSLKASEDFLSAVNTQVSQGILAKSEVDQAQYAVSQSQLELAYAQQAQKDAHDQLLVFSGLALNDQQNIQMLTEIIIEQPKANDFPLVAIEVEVSELNLQIAALEKERSDDEDLPSLDVVASVERMRGNGYQKNDNGRITSEGWRHGSYVGLEFSKTLNDYPVRAQKRRARLFVEDKELELRDVKLRTDVRRAAVQRGFESARQYLMLIKRKIEIANRNLDNERFKMDAGRSTAFLVYAAQSSLDQARSEYIEAMSRYVLAAAQLHKEMGSLNEFVGALSANRCVSSLDTAATILSSKG